MTANATRFVAQEKYAYLHKLTFYIATIIIGFIGNTLVIAVISGKKWFNMFLHVNDHLSAREIVHLCTFV